MPSYKVKEEVVFDNGVASFTFKAGTHEAKDEAEEAALESLVASGHAERGSERKTAKESKEG